MADPARAQRLAKRISTIVASAIGTEIKDPRLNFVTITDTTVTADLHDATVYYTVMGESVSSEPDYERAAEGLARATGVLRSLVGSGTGVRFTPTLTFKPDTVPDAAREMEELVARARAQDELLARQREGATPAGEADPYRSSSSEPDDESAS
ncbi:30S ribosome-binding factor RbfA [Williamsia sp. CHRR-6]|uniref:30S ribosome-binding factor RbfA n=1 Tax=Williamsia sp. CHRR-6 TaxID=2835871 RepID=UPI001BDB17E7|nr:30S ribosome-binding factor RbfA [Williamsia sp. CHRR-6]MBT0567856.1 30S ribosome-binding factor RbfA [Williamsia sp. CHRR-6]